MGRTNKAFFLFIASSVLCISCSAPIRNDCKNTLSAESIDTAGSVLKAFEMHSIELFGKRNDDTGKYLADHRNYDISIATTDSSYIYDFVPRFNGKSFKGGGARYIVNRASGKIESTLYMK